MKQWYWTRNTGHPPRTPAFLPLHHNTCEHTHDCMYQRHDLTHSVIKRGIQNYTKQLSWDIFDKNWATSQCIMNSLVSLEMKPHNSLILQRLPIFPAHYLYFPSRLSKTHTYSSYGGGGECPPNIY